MGRSTNLGAGDICDRLTILALKSLYGTDAGRDTAHWDNERNVLLTMLRGRTLNGPWLEPFVALGAVNAALWQATDHLRTVRADLKAAGEVGLRILDLNDRRSELVDEINRLAGEHVGDEKITAAPR